jgi:hypothetical protein
VRGTVIKGVWHTRPGPRRFEYGHGANKKNLSPAAASIINERPELMAEPRFVRLLTHILTTKYAYAINFSIFALKDLKKGERIEDYRGKPGTYKMAGGRSTSCFTSASRKIRKQ